MTGNDVITALKKKFRTSTDKALANRLGVSGQAIHNWKKRREVTGRQIAALFAKAATATIRAVESDAIRPVVEFYRINKCLSKQGKKYELFEVGKHPYLEGVREELKRHHGVYVFFDSRGQAIYVGMARRQRLWTEITAAFNRKRGDVQTIKRVSHPVRRQDYRTSDEKMRQIKDVVVPLHELASYFSAYRVTDGLIDEVEALLVRSFANDLLNSKMERFLRPGKRKVSKEV